jgi:hypothetical protein
MWRWRGKRFIEEKKTQIIVEVEREEIYKEQKRDTNRCEGREVRNL